MVMPEVAVLVADPLMMVRSGVVMTLLVDCWVMVPLVWELVVALAASFADWLMIVPLGLEALAVLAAGKLALAQPCAGRPVI